MAVGTPPSLPSWKNLTQSATTVPLQGPPKQVRTGPDADRHASRDQEGDVPPGATVMITVALDMHAHNTPQLTLEETTEWDHKQGGRSPESEKPPNQPDRETIKIRADG